MGEGERVESIFEERLTGGDRAGEVEETWGFRFTAEPKRRLTSWFIEAETCAVASVPPRRRKDAEP